MITNVIMQKRGFGSQGRGWPPSLSLPSCKPSRLLCMVRSAALFSTVLILLCSLQTDHGGFLASEQQKEESKGKKVFERSEGGWQTAQSNCSAQESPRFKRTPFPRPRTKDEICFVDLSLVHSSHGDEPDSMLGLLHGLEDGYVEATEIQIQSKADKQTKGADEESKPFQKGQQRNPVGGIFTSGENARGTSSNTRCKRGERIFRGSQDQKWRTRCLECTCSSERPAEDLHLQHWGLGSRDQDSHRIPHSRGERRGSGQWSQTWTPEQSRDLEEKYRQDSGQDQKCRSRVDEVQVHYEEEVSRAERWLQRTTEDPGRDAGKEIHRVPRCGTRAQKTSQCRKEPHGTRASERRAHCKASGRRRAMGSGRLRRGESRVRRQRRKEIEKSCSRAIPKIETKEGVKEGMKQAFDAAPGPNLKAEAAKLRTLEMILTRIEDLRPFHQAFCLTLICVVFFVVESVQYMAMSGTFWAVLAGCMCLLLCLSSFCTRSTRCKRTLCCVRRRRHVKKVFEKRKKDALKFRVILYLVLWSDIGGMALAEKVPMKESIKKNEMEGHNVCSQTDSGKKAWQENTVQEGLFNWSASGFHQGGTSTIMGLQRDLGTQVDEARQAAYERNTIWGEEDIVAEVAALNAQSEQEGFCVMTHALKTKHEGTREMQFSFQHGDDFLDLIFAIRQKWADVINPFSNADIIYVLTQPPPSTTRGVDCLHLIVDGEPHRIGMRNLMAMVMGFQDGQFSDFWFQAQRNFDEVSRDLLIQRFQLRMMCASEAVLCTCRAGLTVFQEGTNYQNQDGLYMTIELALGMHEADEDIMSLMTRAPRSNRLMAYVYRHGDSEPIYVQLSEVPEPQRMNYIFEKMASRNNEEDQVTFSLHRLVALPDGMRENEIFPVIQDFHRDQRESHVIILLDVEVFPQGMTPAARPSDEWREVTYVRKLSSREVFLIDAQVTTFCRSGEGNCFVEKNHVPWDERDESVHELENGSYLKVMIRPQRTDLPFCVQYEQAQQGVQISDMIDTRQYRKRPRGPDEDSSESSDSSTLLQIDNSIRRNFHKEKIERLRPPGNGVGFDPEISVIEDEKETKMKDRSATNRYIAEFCETRVDEPLSGLFLDFVRRVRFSAVDDSSDEEETKKGETESQQIQLEHLLPIRSDERSAIENIRESLKSDPEARYPLRQDWENINVMHPAVKDALHAQSLCLTGTVIRMHIFLDGSSIEQPDGKRKAAWSFVVGLEHDNREGPNCKLAGFAGAPLARTPLSDYYIGEETLDSGESECAAMFWAGLWLLSWGKKCMIETIVHGDNLPTVKATTSEWKCPPTNGRLFEKCRCLWQRIEAENFPITLRHLHGHKGHPGNEAADSVAKHFASSNEVFTGKRTRLARLLATHPDLERFWWYEETTALPLFGSQRMFAPGDDSRQEPVEEEKVDSATECIGVQFVVASVNVFAGLDKEASMMSRRKALAMQAETCGWKIVALQETRYRMSISKRDELYYMYTASATKAGCFGCELWFSKTWEIAGRRIKEGDLHVLVEEPTMIVVAMNHPALQADFFSVHAPLRQHAHQGEWWRKLYGIVKKRKQKGRNVFLLGDMNARIGSDFAEGIGRLHVQEECANGEAFREIINDFDLMLPSTFPLFHAGTGNTFQRHRLDYIAIPLEWQGCIRQSKVAVNFDMLHTKDDHKPITLELSFAATKQKQQKRMSYDKQEVCKPGNAMILEGIFSSFREPDWECSIDDHCNELTRHVYLGLCKAFPCKKRKQEVKQPYIKGHLWDLVLERKNMRNEIRQMKNRRMLNLVKKCWEIWRGNEEASVEMAVEEKLNVKYGAFLEEILADSNRKISNKIKEDKQQCLLDTLASLENAFKRRSNKEIYEALKPFQHQNSRRKLKTPKPLPYLMGDNGIVENQQEWHKAWESHWARIEGARVRNWEEHRKAYRDNKVIFDCESGDILAATPTMLQTESAVRGIKCGKAGGIDEICPDAVRHAGKTAARCIFTLAVKELARGQVPFIDRGGISLPLYKNKGQQCERTSFRSIVLENCFGKTISRLWRPELERSFKALASCSQGGAKKGMGPVTHRS